MSELAGKHISHLTPTHPNITSPHIPRRNREWLLTIISTPNFLHFAINWQNETMMKNNTTDQGKMLKVGEVKESTWATGWRNAGAANQISTHHRENSEYMNQFKLPARQRTDDSMGERLEGHAGWQHSQEPGAGQQSQFTSPYKLSVQPS